MSELLAALQATTPAEVLPLVRRISELVGDAPSAYAMASLDLILHDAARDPDAVSALALVSLLRGSAACRAWLPGWDGLARGAYAAIAGRGLDADMILSGVMPDAVGLRGSGGNT